MIGLEIGSYKIVSKLGEGGMAYVFLAEHKTLKAKKAAVKILKEEFVFNKNIRKRFISEAEKLSRLSHKNIISVLDLIDAGDIVAIVMEYVDGVTLKEAMRNVDLFSDDKIKYFLEQMLKALSHVHDSGYVHRDVKPSNFMISNNGEIKLLDFGIAKNTDENSNDYTGTGTGMQMGTPSYMSPEQVRSSKDVGPTTDIYSLGVILWEMASGTRPYDQDTLSTFDIFKKIVDEPLKETRTPWDYQISKATSKNPESRFESCEEWLLETNSTVDKFASSREIYSQIKSGDYQYTGVKDQRGGEELIPNNVGQPSKNFGFAWLLGVIGVIAGFGLIYFFFFYKSDSTIADDLVGTWKVDVSSLKIDFGDNIPYKIKEEISGEIDRASDRSEENFDLISFVLMDGGKGYAMHVDHDDKKYFDWSIDNGKLILEGELDNSYLKIAVEIDDLASDHVTLSLTGEELLEQLRSQIPKELDEAEAEMKEDMRRDEDFERVLNFEELAEGSAMRITFKKL